MDPTEFWILALCICGAVQCIFLACCLLLPWSGQRKEQLLPALIMLLLAIRIFKSINYLFEGDEMSILIMNGGFAAHLGASIVLYFYMASLSSNPLISIKNRWVHLIPVLTLIVGAPWMSLESFWYRGAYHFLLIVSLLYWFLALLEYYQIRQLNMQNFQRNRLWLNALLSSTGIFFFAYFSNYVLGFITYEMAPAVYSLTVFPIGIIAWQHSNKLQTNNKQTTSAKYQNLSLSPQELENGKSVILAVFQKDKAYLNPQFSLQELSEKTQIPSHLISHLLNQHLNSSFAKLLNQYRVEAACDLLLQTDKKHYSIAAIAFEVGFNSLSSFNLHFKKLKRMTPSAFRRQNTPNLSFPGSEVK